MEHLNRETLARLVDERPAETERSHLETCPACRDELRAMGDQSRALADLPDLLPPVGEWESLEARLREEGLLREARIGSRSGDGNTGSGAGGRWTGRFGPQWRSIAAGIALFIGGAGFGLGASGTLPADRVGPGAFDSEGAWEGPGGAQVSQVATLDDAVEGVRRAEEQYVEALERYRRMLEGSGEESYDPISRFAALDALVAASQAAVREAPTDPFLNGMLLSTVAERQATLRRISYGNDNWY